MMSTTDAKTSAASARPRCFAFVFPMASGHINPSLPVARSLVRLGHRVHYLCREQMREAIEDTGATFHSDVENEPEMYEGREPGLFAAMEAVQKERGMEDDSMMVALCKLSEIMLEMQLPGVIRWLRKLRADAVVHCPMMNPEAAYGAKVLGIPCVALLTTAGPGSVVKAVTEMLAVQGLSADDMVKVRESYAPARECVERLRAEYGISRSMSLVYKPLGRMETVMESHLTLVTTCEGLQDPMTPELAQVYRDANVKFACVGPLLDAQEGARRAAGHKYHGEEHKEEHQDAAEQRSAVALLREARAAGRKVVLVSMGTVITGDSPDFGWDARMRGADGQPRGLTGRELCQAAWGGAFDAFGAEKAQEGPLLLVALGPQPDALGDLKAPSNACCMPILPQVDLLKAGVDLFLTHGGQNSFTEALSVGTPIVVCPGFGDQVVNAQKAADLGVGLQVVRPMPDPGQEAAAAAAYRTEVASALHEVFNAEPFRGTAERYAEQLRVAGGVPRAVSLLLEVSEPHGHADAAKNAGTAVRAAEAVAHVAGA